MFQRLGIFTAQHRKPIIITWVALAALLMAITPAIEDVSSTDQADFLPADAPFVRAQELYQELFPDEFSPSSTMLLIDAGDGGDVHDPEIWAFIQQTEAWLNSDAAPGNVVSVAAPTGDPRLADLLISPEGRIALISAALDTPMDAAVTVKAVEAIDDWLEEHEPETFAVYQTGEAALNAQAEESTFTTMDRTLVITFVLVVVALLAIYRSPVSPLIPLFTVTVAFMATLGLVGVLADLELMTVIAQVIPLLVVVMYGAGTDYCLFLVSRFREEMAHEPNVEPATRRTVHMVGETISSSAGTIFVGFISMSFAEMGTFQSAGPMLALGIVTSLLAGLTLAPALLATLGNRAFWPGKAGHRSAGRWYELVSKQVSSRPLATILIIVAIMTPFSVYGLSRDLNYDMVSELPDDIDSVQAYNLLREHMGGGNLFPLTVIVTGRETASLVSEVERLTGELSSLQGVSDVRSLTRPLGQNSDQMDDWLRVDAQLGLMLALDEQEQGDQEGGLAQALEMVQGLQGYLALLRERFPQVSDDPHLQTAAEILEGGLPALATREDEFMAAVAGLAERFQSIEGAELLPVTPRDGLLAPFDLLYGGYLSGDGAAYRLDVVLDDPIGEAGLDVVPDIRAVLKPYQGDGETAVSGTSAMLKDIQSVMDRDQIRTFGFILAGIFIVLLLMLRSVVAPLYLIGTVVLSFTCTLGLTSLFFAWAYDVDKLSWLLPVFMFVFLVALGIDYSIFLFGRIKEEVGQHGIREGVHVAVAATGAIITSAGVILAGTFAGMMAGEVMFLAQLGFAVSVGVLIDTFVVRTILDPALAALFGRWTWWPGGVPQAPAPRTSVAAPVELGD